MTMRSCTRTPRQHTGTDPEAVEVCSVARRTVSTITRPRALPRIVDRETRECAPMLPMAVYAREVTAAEVIEAPGKGSMPYRASWPTLATRTRGEP
jgi:hypothetical protein